MKIFTSGILFIVCQLLLVANGQIEESVPVEASGASSGEANNAGSASETSVKYENLPCPKESEPMIDLTFYLYTGSEMSDQDFLDLKYFLSKFPEHLYMSADSSKGIRLFGVTFASRRHISKAFDNVYNEATLSEALHLMRKERSKFPDLNKAFRRTKTMYNYRTSSEYMGRVGILITNTPTSKYGILTLSHDLKQHYLDGFIVIGILSGNYNEILEFQIKRLASEKNGNSTIWTFDSYSELRNPAVFLEIANTFCGWVQVSSTCGEPEAPEHGTVVFESTNVNDLAIYECNEGYSTTYPLTRRCLQYATWSGPVPICSPTCDMPTAPVDGRTLFWHAYVGSRIQYRCLNNNFKMTLPDGSRKKRVNAFCLATLEWSLAPPNCTREVVTPAPVAAVGSNLNSIVGLGQAEDGSRQTPAPTPIPNANVTAGNIQMRAGMNVRTTHAPEKKKDPKTLVPLSLVQAAAAVGVAALIGLFAWQKLKAASQPAASATEKQKSGVNPAGDQVEEKKEVTVNVEQSVPVEAASDNPAGLENKQSEAPLLPETSVSEASPAPAPADSEPTQA